MTRALLTELAPAGATPTVRPATVPHVLRRSAPSSTLEPSPVAESLSEAVRGARSESRQGSRQQSKREWFAAAVTAVLRSHRALASAHAAHAVLVEEARLAGVAMHSQDTFRGGPQWSSQMVAEREVITELAVALHLTENDARTLIHTREALTGAFGSTMTALQSGEISYRHAEKIIRHSHTLPTANQRAYETELLPAAKRVSVQRLERLARAAIEHAQPDTAIQRHTDAAACRRLYLEPGSDGMAYLTLYLPAVEAVAVHNRATDMARSAKNSGDPRTLTQLRLDTLTDLLLNADPHTPTVTPGIRAHVNITVPVLTLLHPPPTTRGTTATNPITGAPQTTATGSDPSDPDNPDADTAVFSTATHAVTADAAVDERFEALTRGLGTGRWAELEGYGPIDQHTALLLTRNAPSIRRILTDPLTGVALAYGRERYRPPSDLDELIRLTHTECTFPLDCTPSTNADLDHTIAWNDGGTTDPTNISPLCTSHHKVKHHTTWTITQTPGGTITWTSPAGFQYDVEPTPLTPPQPHPTPTVRRTPQFTDQSADHDTSPPF